MLMMLLIIFNNAIIIAFLWPTHPRGLIRVQIKIKSGFLRDDRLQPLRSTDRLLLRLYNLLFD